jgi:hypothetical protein
MSHGPWQHDGSSEHTALQQTASSHAPTECVSKQLPLVTEPQVPGVPPQRKDAVAAHVASQRVEQQKGSFAQTDVQHVAESQPGFVWAEVHGPLAVAPQ